MHGAVLELISRPIQLGVTVAKGAVDTSLGLVRAAAGLVIRDADADRFEVVHPPPSPPEHAGNGGAPPAQPRPAAPPPRPAAPPPPPPTEGHVSEEPVQVAEFAEPGAEDGPGPELEIDEPWDGYARQDARTVVQLLSTVGRESAAAIELYEASHRNRRTVLEAAQRRLTVLSSGESR
jgi:hypothetical protein